MAEMSLNPTTARKNFFNLLKTANDSHQAVEIISDRKEYNAVVIGLDDWRSIEETLFLEQTGVMDKVRKREKDNTGFSAVSELDWDSL